MSEIEDTVNYNLIDGDEVVYKGSTKDPKRREQEHRAEGMKFTRLMVTSRRLTAEVAYRRELQALDRYRLQNQGRNPKYNKSYWGNREAEAPSK